MNQNFKNFAIGVLLGAVVAFFVGYGYGVESHIGKNFEQLISHVDKGVASFEKISKAGERIGEIAEKISNKLEHPFKEEQRQK